MKRGHSRHSNPDGFMPRRYAFESQHGHHFERPIRPTSAQRQVAKRMQHKKDRQRVMTIVHDCATPPVSLKALRAALNARICRQVLHDGDGSAAECGHRYDAHQRSPELSARFGVPIHICVPCTEATGPFGKRTVIIHNRVEHAPVEA